MSAIAGPRVAVIGGGYAGMAAAIGLSRSGCMVAVFESGPVLGGRARRIEYQGLALDNGQHILSGAYSALQELMRTVGGRTDTLARVPLQLSMPPDFLLRAPGWPAPWHTLGALGSARGLTWRDRWAAARFMLHLRRRKYRVGAATTVAQLLQEQAQPPALISYLWAPLTISALNTPLEAASAQVFVNVLRDALAADRAASDLLLPRADLSALFPEPAAEWIVRRGGIVRLGARVSAIDVAPGCFQVVLGNQSESFDGVVVAIGPHQFDALSLPAELAPPALNYEPIVTVYLRFDQPVRLASPMFGQSTGIAQWFFDRSAITGETGNASTIAAVISASGPHQAFGGQELALKVQAELTRHVTNLPKPVWSKVITEKFATFACTPDAQSSRPPVQTRLPGLWLAGDYTCSDYPATLESAARSGLQAAAMATSHFKSRLPGRA